MRNSLLILYSTINLVLTPAHCLRATQFGFAFHPLFLFLHHTTIARPVFGKT